MSKRVSVWLIVLGLSTTCYAQSDNNRQSTCTVRQAPAIRGIQLGMTTDQLIGVLPGGRENPDIKRQLENQPRFPFERVALTLHGSGYRSSAMFANINQIGVTLFDDRVISVRVSYDGLPWNSVDQLLTIVSKSLGLPAPEKWQPVGGQTRSLRCEGFAVSVTALPEHSCCSSIWLQDLVSEQKMADRKKEYWEKRQREFKP